MITDKELEPNRTGTFNIFETGILIKKYRKPELKIFKKLSLKKKFKKRSLWYVNTKNHRKKKPEFREDRKRFVFMTQNYQNINNINFF